MAKNLEIDLMKIIEEYKDEIDKIADEDFKRVADETVRDLRQTSPKDKGRYARSWKVKKTTGFGGKTNYIVYNQIAGLTHLLEHGHAVRPTPTHAGRKSRVEGQPHIIPAEDRARERLIQLLEDDL